MATYYAVECLKHGKKVHFLDAYTTAKQAKDAARDWVNEQGHGAVAIVLKELPREGRIGHYWKEFSVCVPQGIGAYPKFVSPT